MTKEELRWGQEVRRLQQRHRPLGKMLSKLEREYSQLLRCEKNAEAYFVHARQTFAEISQWIGDIERCRKWALSKYPQQLGKGDSYDASDIWKPKESGHPLRDVSAMCDRASNYLEHLAELTPASQRVTTRHRGRPPDPELQRIRAGILRVFKELKSEGEEPSHERLCSMLDHRGIPLPQRPKWAKDSPNWSTAYKNDQKRVAGFLSVALHQQQS